MRKTIKQLQEENEELQLQLAEAQETLTAIRNGEVDAIVIQDAEGEKIFSISSSETPYRIIIEEMQEGAVVISTDGLILYCNRRFAELVDIKMEQVSASNFTRFVKKTELRTYYQLFKKGTKERFTRDLEYNTSAKNTKFLRLSFSPLPQNMLGDICITVFDLTMLKLNEEDLLRSQHSLQERTGELNTINAKAGEMNKVLQDKVKELAKSNNELEQFAHVASHDLQEPLRMVTSFLWQLEKKYGNIIDDRGKKYIYFAVDGARRMHQIILDLLEFSRAGIAENNLESVDLNELVEEIKILFSKQVEENDAIIHAGVLPVINTYKVPLRQVFQNLVSNALKYSKKNTGTQINITFNEFTNYWQFAVSDNGIGIAGEYFDKIFVIFQRLHNKDEFSGTGIGLAITKKVIENQGGNIWVESEEGKGSTFYFTLLKQH